MTVNKEIFATREEMEEFVTPMLEEKKWVLDVHQYVQDGPFTVFWFEHKKYTDENGKEQMDELWRTDDCVIHLIQDMDVDMLRHALRYIMRSGRVTSEAVELVHGLGGEDDEEEPFSPYVLPGSTTLQ